MTSSVRRAVVAAAIVAVTATGGAASAQEPDGDSPSGDLTEQLSGGADTLSETFGRSSEEESTRDGDDRDGDDDSGILLPGDQGRDLLGEGFTELSGRGIDELRAVTDNLTDPINEVVCELTDDELELLDLTRTDIQLLGDCPQAPAEDESDDKDVDKPEDKPAEDESDDGHGSDQPDADNDDSHTVPTGGIETGAGGTAGSTAPAALGTLSMVAAGAALAWRRRLGAPV